MFAVRYKKIFLASGLLFIVGSVVLLAVMGLRLGLDFTGGALTEVAYDEKPVKTVFTEKLDLMGFRGYSLRDTVGDSGRDGYILRTRDLSEQERVNVTDALTSQGVNAQIMRFTSIGPVIGQELKDKAIWAIIAVSLVIIIYVAFAFRGISYPVGSWMYGGITIFALLHDVLIPTAFMAVLGYFAGVEVNVLFVMALLAVLGYSVNDTIVVFDRVRENLIAFRKEKKTKKKVAGVVDETVTYTLTKPFSEIVGMSVSQTLMRSINTSATTLLALIALYFFGGEATQTFALVLIVGVVAGTYSSIFLASPLLILISEQLEKKKDK